MFRCSRNIVGIIAVIDVVSLHSCFAIPAGSDSHGDSTTTLPPTSSTSQAPSLLRGTTSKMAANGVSSGAHGLRAAAASTSPGEVVPECSGQPGWDLAKTIWCRDQLESYACYKDISSINPVWDCRIPEGGRCSAHGHLCQWRPRSPTSIMSTLVSTNPTPLGQIVAVPSCNAQHGWDTARRSWCGEQPEPYACFKEPSAANQIWDCHLREGARCSAEGRLCLWRPMASTSTMPALVSSSPAPLGQTVAVPPCNSQHGWDTARRSWCGEQQEPYACFKEPAAANQIWDCHLHEGARCSAEGKMCHWRPSETQEAEPSAPTPAVGVATRFMSWNVYFASLRTEWRVNGIAEGIVRVGPEIASIQEMMSEKRMILERLRAISPSGHQWAFAEGGVVDISWDGDILYRSDLWEHLDSGVVFNPRFPDRGISWAALRRRADGVGVLAYGIHPICCAGDEPVMTLVNTALDDMVTRQAQYGFPIVFMGDMNSGYYEPSQAMLRHGSKGIAFTDPWAQMNPANPNPSTIGNHPVRIDYVYFQQEPMKLGHVIGSQVWFDLPGGSDHRAVSGDVVIPSLQH